MKSSLIILVLLIQVKLVFCQHDVMIKSIPTKFASFYHPLFENKLVSGQWIGDVYTPKGLDINLINGSGTFVLMDPNTKEVLFKFKGNADHGIWNGYMYYLEKSKRGNLFVEGNFKSGLLHGKVICKLIDGSYFAGTFHFGESNDKISLRKNNELLSTYCSGFNFMQFLKNESSQWQKCKRETTLDDPLYGAAIIISNIATLADKHTSIDKFMECVRLNDVEIFIKNPDFAMVGAEAIKSILKNPFWKDLSQEEIQFHLKHAVIENKYENLSKSFEYLSFLGCVIEESRKW